MISPMSSGRELTRSYLSHLVCPICSETSDPDEIHTFCHACESPLLARYDLAQAGQAMIKEDLKGRTRGLWRWRELLPVRDDASLITLGEGDSPLLPATRLGTLLGLKNLYVKDDSSQPTGSFKARGLAVAVSKASELGIREFVIPTAGNAGGSLAAYAARAGLEAHVFMPADAPIVNQAEVLASGADLQLVNGLIGDAGRLAAQAAREHGWFDVSTFREPYRMEGKKTMGLELAEAFGWEVPEVIIYPTGGGTGLVGMWKAFDELEGLGWIDSRRPRMVAVQAAGCAPVVAAYKAGESRVDPWPKPQTAAAGLRVPHPFADRLILEAIRDSEGCALAVSEEEIAEAQRTLACREGVFAAPEGAATLAAAIKLQEEGWMEPSWRVVLYNTGSGLKYLQ